MFKFEMDQNCVLSSPLFRCQLSVTHRLCLLLIIAFEKCKKHFMQVEDYREGILNHFNRN